MRLQPAREIAMALLLASACHPSGADSSAPKPSSPASASSPSPAAAPSASAAPIEDCDGGLGYGASCDGRGSGEGVPGRAHDPHAPRVEATLLQASNGLPGEVVIRVVRQSLPVLRRCHLEAGGDAAPPEKGHVRVALDIDASGKVGKATDAGSTLGAAAASCMVGALSKIAFPAPERMPMSARVEVKVSPPSP